VRQLSGFRWSVDNIQTGAFFLSLIALVFGSFYLLPLVWSSCLGIVALVVASGYSMRTLVHLVCFDRIPRSLQPFLAWLRPAAARP
jgi:hypothetical protein